MSYKQQLQEHYKAVKQRLMKNAIVEKKALPPPTPAQQEPPKAGLLSEKSENQIVTDALSISEEPIPYSTMQALRLANEMMNSPRLPPLPGLVINEIGTVRWMRILKAVAAKHGVDPSEIMGKSRRRIIAEARFEVFYRLRVDLAFSYVKIADIMKKDHSTVMHGVHKVRKKLLDERVRLSDDGGSFLVNHLDQSGTQTDLSAA